MIGNSKAIILNKRQYRETSLIVTFYTQNFGKLIGLVKGALRKNKYNSKFNLFSVNQIVFHKKENNELAIISECNLIESYQEVREDIYKTSCGLYFIELLDVATEKQDINPELFKLFLIVFEMLRKGINLENVSRVFEVRLLCLSGLMPRIDGCVFCGKKIYETAWFSRKLGGLLCEKCLSEDFKSVRLLKGTVLSINKLINNEILFLKRLYFTNEVSIQLKDILTQFLFFHLDREIKSRKFLQQLEQVI